MKKGIAVFLCFIMLILSAPAVRSAEIFDVPVIRRGKTVKDGNDVIFSFTSDCGNAAGYERERLAIYEELSRQYSDAALIAAGEGWVTYPTLLYIEIETAGRRTFFTTRSVTETAFSLSLKEDVLPALVASGLYTHEKTSFRLYFTVVIDSGPMPTTATAETSLGPFNCPATAHVTYMGTEEAENPNPTFVFLPTPALPLINPTRVGYVFAGWISGKTGGYVGELPEGFTEDTLTATWTPRTYKINYVLTTRPGYFVYVDNTGNPTVHTYGVSEQLLALTPPYGYVFSGWYEDPAFSGERVVSVPEDRMRDTVLYARWQTTEEYKEEVLRTGHWCDLDDDGNVTASDARLALRTSVGLEKLPGELAARADFHGNGRITAETARRILRIAVGLDSVEETLTYYGIL